MKISKNFDQLNKYTRQLFKKYNELILEEFIGGQEIQVAIIDDTPIGAIELVPSRSFYDYKAKILKVSKD